MDVRSVRGLVERALAEDPDGGVVVVADKTSETGDVVAGHGPVPTGRRQGRSAWPPSAEGGRVTDLALRAARGPRAGSAARC